MYAKFFKIALEQKLHHEKEMAAKAKGILRDVLLMTNFNIADIIKYYYAVAKEIDRPFRETQQQIDDLRHNRL